MHLATTGIHCCCCYTNLKISLQWSINGRHVSVTLLYTVNWIITELLNMLVSFHIIYPRYWYWICHSTSLILFFECPDYSRLWLLTSFHFWSLSLTDRAKISAVKNLFCQLCLSQRAKLCDVTSEKCKIIFAPLRKPQVEGKYDKLRCLYIFNNFLLNFNNFFISRAVKNAEN